MVSFEEFADGFAGAADCVCFPGSLLARVCSEVFLSIVFVARSSYSWVACSSVERMYVGIE